MDQEEDVGQGPGFPTGPTRYALEFRSVQKEAQGGRRETKNSGRSLEFREKLRIQAVWKRSLFPVSIPAQKDKGPDRWRTFDQNMVQIPKDSSGVLRG